MFGESTHGKHSKAKETERINTQTEDGEPPPVFFCNAGGEAATFFEKGLAMFLIV